MKWGFHDGLVPLIETPERAFILSLFHIRHSEKAAIYNPRRELSPQVNAPGTSILAFWSPEL